MGRGKRFTKDESDEKTNNSKFLILFVVILSVLMTSFLMNKNTTRSEKTSNEVKEKTNISITLNGDETIYLYKNEEYKDEGIKAVDENGNDVSKNIDIESNVDSSKSGEYSVKYVDKNDKNNYVQRKVIVRKSEILEKGKKSNNKLPVLMYHYFYDKSKGETGKNANWLEISKFEEQLKYLKDNNYYYPTWDEVEDFVLGKIDLPKKSVVITMDDGHKSLYKHAIPVLKKYNIPATAFIITKKIDSKKLEKYKDSTIDFESHTDNMHRARGKHWSWRNFSCNEC